MHFKDLEQTATYVIFLILVGSAIFYFKRYVAGKAKDKSDLSEAVIDYNRKLFLFENHSIVCLTVLVFLVSAVIFEKDTTILSTVLGFFWAISASKAVEYYIEFKVEEKLLR